MKTNKTIINLQSKEYVSFNRQIYEKEKAKISIQESALIYGLAVYETVLALNSKIVFWEKHQNRLKKGLVGIGVDPALLETQDVHAHLLELLTYNQLKHARIRITVSRGTMQDLETIHQNVPGQMFITMKALPLNYDRLVLQTPYLKLTVYQKYSSYKPIPPHMKLTGLTNLFMLALMEIKKAGYDDGVFCNSDGYLSEGTTFNIFWVKADQWYTPALNTGILSGITRQQVLDILKDAGKTVHQGYYKKETIYQADEVLITSSVRGVVGVHQLDQVQYSQKQHTPWLISEYWRRIQEL